jgi:DUF1009 family protein
VKYNKLGLIAGGGDLPLIFLRNAQKAGQEVVVFEIQGEGNPGLAAYPFRKVRINITHLEEMINVMKAEAIRHVMFLGYVRPEKLLKDIIFDERTRKTFLGLLDKRPKALMESAMNEFKKDGITAIASTYLMEEALAPTGKITNIEPDIRDMNAAIDITRKLAGMDVGQTVVAGSGMIWAVESAEGTDNCIKRGGKLAKNGFTVIKMARPKQDLRYDVPAIGLKTLKLIKSLKGSGIVIEAGRTFMLNKEELLRYADNNNLFIYGWRQKK